MISLLEYTFQEEFLSPEMRQNTKCQFPVSITLNDWEHFYFPLNEEGLIQLIGESRESSIIVDWRVTHPPPVLILLDPFTCTGVHVNTLGWREAL